MGTAHLWSKTKDAGPRALYGRIHTVKPAVEPERHNGRPVRSRHESTVVPRIRRTHHSLGTSSNETMWVTPLDADAQETATLPQDRILEPFVKQLGVSMFF